MTIFSSKPRSEIIYPYSDSEPMAESDPARDYLIYGVEALNIYFQNREDVYVSGNLFIYYQPGNKSAVVAPDVFVVFGVEKKKRLSYKIWEEEGKVPGFVLEVTSETTKKNDEEEKPIKYARLGVAEYFQYDPTGDYLQPQLKGSCLRNGKYEPITPEILSGEVLRIHSQVLGLDLRLTEGKLRFYVPKTGRKLLTHQETEQARQDEVQGRQQAELAYQKETQARRDGVSHLLELDLTVEQVAQALGFSVEEVREISQK